MWGLGFRRVGGVVVAGSLTIAAAGWSGAASADSVLAGYELAKQNACLGCHTVERKRVGPGFREIATKYRGDPTSQAQVQARLEKKVRDGGSGVWGVIPMPAHPRMSDADIHTVVAWVLAGAPTSSSK